MKTVVVIPAYNESQVIAEVVRAVREVVPHVVVVDDGSADTTAREAAEGGAAVLRHAINRGQGAALQTGISAALERGADVVVTFDADGQMSPSDIPAIIGPVVSGESDIVLGSRFLKGENASMPALRRWTLKAALAFTRFTTGLELTDTHNGLRALSRQAAAALVLRCDRMAHASEILEQVAVRGLRYQEVPVTVRYTAYSMKKGQKLGGVIRIIRDLIVSSWTR